MVGKFSKMEVFIDGCHAGEVSADGDLWREGERQGELSGDMVWREGECIAQLGADGVVWYDSSIVGSLETDGSLWLEGERVANFEDSGEVWVSGEKRVVVTHYQDNAENRRALAVFCLFFSSLFDDTLRG